MKRFLLIAALGSLALTGCSKPQATVYSGDGGKVTTDGQGNMSVTDDKGNKVDMKVGEEGWSAKTNDGAEVKVDKSGMTGKNEKGETYSMGTSAVTESELGLPFYPGSVQVEGRDMKIKSGDKESFVSVRSTSDSGDKVVAFYKEKVKEPATSSAGDMSAVGGKLDDGRTVAIMAIKKDGKVEVQVSVSKD